MKMMFPIAVLALAVSTSSVTFSEARVGVDVVTAKRTKDSRALRRNLADECPSTWTISPDTGWPSYQCNLDCDCSSPNTFKDDVGAVLGQPGCYRCSKDDGETCSEDFECGLDIQCIQGTCNGNGGVGQCPSHQGPGGAPFCEPTLECECTDNGFTLKENLGPTAAPCYHCSKPMGAACTDRDECSALDFNNNVICFEGKCSVQCPRGQGLCGDSDCVCPTAEFPLQEEFSPGTGCYVCVKPIGDPCTHYSECGEGSTCKDGVCSTELLTCHAYENDYDDSTGTFEFGLFVNKDDSNPPCQCDDPAYPTLLVIEFNDDTEIEEGGGNFGYICTNESVSECPHEYSFNDDGMAVRECQRDMLIGIPNLVCDCTMGSYTVKEELLEDCYRCAKPDGTTCSDDAECEYGSHCDDATGTCSSAPQNCNSYDGVGDYSFGYFWDDDCSGAPCVCGDPAYPNLEIIEFDSNNNIVAGGGYCGYVCSSGGGTPPSPTNSPPPDTDLPDCNPYDGSGTIYFGSYTNNDSSNPPCGCSDSNYPNLYVADTSWYFGYVCKP